MPRNQIEAMARGKKANHAEMPSTTTLPVTSGDLEMRRSPRLFMNLQINYQLKNSQGWKSGHTVDASKEGLSIFSREKMEMRQNFQIKFPYPTPIDPLEIAGRIVWMKPILKEGFRSGIKIVGISKENQIRFEKLLSDFGVSLYRNI